MNELAALRILGLRGEIAELGGAIRQRSGLEAPRPSCSSRESGASWKAC